MQSTHNQIEREIVTGKREKIIFSSNFVSYGTDVAVRHTFSRLCKSGLLPNPAKKLHYTAKNRASPAVNDIKPEGFENFELDLEKSNWGTIYITANAIAKNSEQEDLKSDLKAATAALDKLLADISASMSEAVKVVKLTVPQHQWVEFGITAKR